MNRRNLLTSFLVLPAAYSITGCTRPSSASEVIVSKATSGDFSPLSVPPPNWQTLLPADRYRILFEEDTERAGSSPLDDEHGEGTFVCAACYLPMFKSEDKFNSGTGWPSFTQPIAGNMATKTDFKMLLPRKEYHCARCTGHQGHVFKDGPKPRGERWCNNGLALVFVAADDTLPELRG